MNKIRQTILFKKLPIEASAPCRIDMGGTLDISTFYYPLRHLSPCTFNIAIGLRTRVKLLPHTRGRIKISSAGFQSAEYPADEAPFDHPLGLMFAIAAYFRARGIHIEITSGSPLKSALGGSSSAGVALIGALSKLYADEDPGLLSRKRIALLAHDIETLAAQGPCGIQDQLAAAYGGVHAWYWRSSIYGSVFTRKVVVRKKDFKKLEACILLAYCGVSHESLDINKRWVKQFISGETRTLWEEIVHCTHGFVDALTRQDIPEACRWMNAETAIRRRMTPDVLDDVGEKLVEAAISKACGARFAGAGGGGCLWALGEKENIVRLKDRWEKILAQRQNACLLDSPIDSAGLLYH
jgi:D-glycero-alpha-D-manno-heptose-7-phosphate kinase